MKTIFLPIIMMSTMLAMQPSEQIAAACVAVAQAQQELWYVESAHDAVRAGHDRATSPFPFAYTAVQAALAGFGIISGLCSAVKGYLLCTSS